MSALGRCHPLTLMSGRDSRQDLSATGRGRASECLECGRFRSSGTTPQWAGERGYTALGCRLRRLDLAGGWALPPSTSANRKTQDTTSRGPSCDIRRQKPPL